MSRFYAVDPETGRQVDVTMPVSTDGLDLQPEITPQTLINLWDKNGDLITTLPIDQLPVSVAEVRKVLEQKGRP